MKRILVVDDDKEIAMAIGIYLENEGYSVIKAYDGQQALEAVQKEPVQLILMDIMMPGMDGIEVTREIRRQHNIPIIMLTAKSEDYDKINGLNVGADDYITKPFNPMELVARVRACFRRYTELGAIGQKEDENIYRTGGLIINSATKKVVVDGRDVVVTPTEFRILEFLVRNADHVFSIKEIYEHVWKEPAYNPENTVAVHIRHLRSKIEINPKEPRYIKVVWGVGYKVERID